MLCVSTIMLNINKDIKNGISQTSGERLQSNTQNNLDNSVTTNKTEVAPGESFELYINLPKLNNGKSIGWDIKISESGQSVSKELKEKIGSGTAKWIYLVQLTDTPIEYDEGTRIATLTYTIPEDATIGSNIAITVKGDIVGLTSSDENSIDQTVTVNVVKKEYTVTFDANGGELPEGSKTSVTVEHGTTYGEIYEELPIAEREGHDFAGWYTQQSGGEKITEENTTKILGNTRIYAQWEGIYTLTVNPGEETYEGKTGETEEITAPVKERTVKFETNEGNVIAPIKKSAPFHQWSLTGGGSINDEEANPVEYTFGEENGTLEATYELSGFTETLPLPEKEGYEFEGWYYDEGFERLAGKANADLYVDEDTTLYAKWEKIYTITYNANGGEGGATSQTGNGEVSLSSDVPKRNGYTFIGWSEYEEAIDEEDYMVPGTKYNLTKDVTLYAQWDVNYPEVHIKVNGEEVEDKGKVELTEDATIVLEGNTAEEKEDGISYTIKKEEDEIKSGTIKWLASLPATIGNLTENGTYTITGKIENADKETEVTITVVINKEEYTLTVNPGGKTYKGTAGETVEIDAPVKERRVTYETNGGNTIEEDQKQAPFYLWNTPEIGGINDEEANPVEYTFGEGNSTLEAIYELSYFDVVLPLPEKEGYEFEGWYYDEGFERLAGKANESLNLSEDTILYAKWKIIEYEITYNLNQGQYMDPNANPKTYTIETETFTLENPWKEGCTFIGWTGTGITGTQQEVTIEKGSTGERTYTANWSTNEYTVTFDANGGELPEGSKTSVTVEHGTTYGEIYEELPIAEREGHDFAGWYTQQSGGEKITEENTTKILGNTRIYAQWEGIYTLTVNPGEETYEGKTGETEEITAPVKERTVKFETNEGNVIAPIKKSAPFHQWSLTGGGSINDEEANPVEYTFGEENGTLEATYELSGFTETLPLPEKEGYEFEGWYYDEGFERLAGKANADLYVDEDTTLYAKWEKIYTITYNANGGEGGATSQTGNGEVSLSSDVPKRNGYTFIGWSEYEEAIDEEDYMVPGTKYNLTKDVTLYAQWDVNYPEVHIKVNGEEVEDKGKVELTEDATIVLEGNTAEEKEDGISYTIKKEEDEIKSGTIKWLASLPATIGNLTENGTYTITGKIENADKETEVTITVVINKEEYTLTVNPGGKTYKGTAGETVEIDAPVKERRVTYETNGGNTIEEDQKQAPFYLWNTPEIGGINDEEANPVEYTFGEGNSTLEAIYELSYFDVILPLPEKEGYEFKGWYYDEGFERLAGEANADLYIDEDTTLFAKWEKEKPIITLPITDFRNNKYIILNEEYKIEGNKVIREGITVDNFLQEKNFPNTKYIKKVYNEKGEEITGQELISTGGRVDILNQSGYNVATYYIVIKGDIDQNGIVDVYDIQLLIETYFEKRQWTDAKILAGQCAEDNIRENEIPNLYDITRLIEYHFNDRLWDE